jgi:hypothetical protein
VLVPGVDADESLAPDHPALQVERVSGPTKTRKTFRLVAFSPRVDFRVHNTNLTAIVRAVKERLLFVCRDGVFIPTPEPEYEAIFATECLDFLSAFRRHVQYTAPYSKEQFLGTFDGRRRAMYEKAFESLARRPLRLSDSFVDFFVKCEKTIKWLSAPRGISPRSKRYNCSLGPFVKRIEKKIYKIIGKVYGATTVFKGLNARASASALRAHWDHFNDPVAVGLDASRFDQHVSQPALRYEHTFYKLFYLDSKLLAKLLRWQEINSGYARTKQGTVKFKVKGKRMSGDCNTGLGNCLISCALFYTYAKSVGLVKFRFANNGDDCVVILERKDLHRLNTLYNWFMRYGFDMKVEKPVDVFEQIDFCQTRPVWTPEGWIMVRNVPTSIAKDCLSLKPLDNFKIFKRWCTSVGQCGMSLTGGIPIVQEFYQALIRSGEGAKPLVGELTLETGFARLAIGMDRRYQEIHPMTRASFWRAFGITPDKQIAFEQDYHKLAIDYDAPHNDREVSTVYL